ncbi:hypothetical protein CERSUDRAFT_55172 [Gelatoporia subvermispora B]|uniref:Uncharacterized protein n=1 Tax=Ceriporiopsis subvermispora (strain B) TaxID=914234 RepID=M2QC14_CERS8|nr:hypothetical protein CERSUDRAFT_55172 [Gelatoporia subvermispora B]
MLQPDFSPEHVIGLNTRHQLKVLDEYGATAKPFSADDGWREASVKIKLPKERISYDSEDAAPDFEIPGVQYRPILEVLKAAYQDPQAAYYHYTPHKTFWQADAKPGEELPPAERIYSEVYNSDAMLEEDRVIQEAPRNPADPPDLEYAVAPIMLWSDSTHLAQFGTSSLWPIYLLLGNQTKYERGKPSAHAAQHLAYILSLPDTIQDLYQTLYGIAATAAVLTFCKRDLFQAVWLLLLQCDEFLEAYIHGFVVLCGDGIKRRLFPRFLTYSADYPEKVLIACIRFLARCPCPICLVTKDKIPLMGTRLDLRQRLKWCRVDTTHLRRKITMTRQWLFEKGYSLLSTHLAKVLDNTSLTPTQSAFSKTLGHLGFNHYAMLAPDLMHEFELGVWKAVFTHLMRILHAAGEDKIQEFNKR